MNSTLNALLARVDLLEALYSDIKDVCKTTGGRRLETNTPCGGNAIDTSSIGDDDGRNGTTDDSESIGDIPSSTNKNLLPGISNTLLYILGGGAVVLCISGFCCCRGIYKCKKKNTKVRNTNDKI